MNTQEIFTQIKEQVAEIEAEIDKTSKSARKRCRTAATKIKKLVGEFKKASMAEDKA